MSKGLQKYLWVAIAFFFISLTGIVRAQDQQPPTDSLSADEIVQILQDNPELLADAKNQIAQKANDNGYEITAEQINDQQVFDQIRTNDDVRARFSDELIARGFGHPAEPPTPTTQTTPSKPTPSTTTPTAKNTTTNQPPKTTGTNETSDTTTKPTLPLTANGSPYRDLSALNDLYGQATVRRGKLERFGASLFKNSAGLQGRAMVDVAVSPDYVLGPGDELSIQYNGGEARKLDLTIDHEGRISLPVVGAVMLAGKTLGDARQVIQAQLSHEYRDVTVDVSLARVRTVRVYVVGDVKEPGAYDISALSTPLNALLVAGGPTDTGSMRTLKHYRGRTLVEDVDLYDLLLKGVNAGQSHLQSGDSILIPPIGPQVTVSGQVRRPAIYELHGAQTLDQVLDLAGGVLVSGELGRIRVERIQAHERKVMLNLDLPTDGNHDGLRQAFTKFSMQDGDYVTVSRILPHTDQTVYLQGHVFRPGPYPFKDGATVKDLIGSFDDLLPEAADRAEIVRLAPPDYKPQVVPFNLRAVLEGHEDAPKLQAFDTIRVYGRYEADAPTVAIYGEVLRPGVYPLSERMSAADLVRMAGGFRRSAFTDNADLASYQIVDGSRVEVETRLIPIGRALTGDPDTDIRLHPGDVLTIRRLGGWDDIGGAISVEGQVLHPGQYGIQPGEHLSSILKRAGGFIDDAYPNGAVLERKQVKEIAIKNRDDLIRKLQEQEIDGEGRVENVRVSRQRQTLIDQLKQIQPSGRMVIRISSQIEKWQGTSEDVEVRPGDTIVIPKTPNFVLVAGQVYNPTAIAYTPGRSANWYLQQAGGATALGNRKEAFVIRANGSVVGRGSGEIFTGGALDTALQPGDTVYVPEKLAGSKKLQNIATAAQVTSGIAIAAHVAGVF
jgi:protein involved in polysaccharide export with SLBB domain